MKAKARGGRICLRLALHPSNSPSRPIASSIWALSALRNCSWRVAASSRARGLPQAARYARNWAGDRPVGRSVPIPLHPGRRRSSALDPAGWPRHRGFRCLRERLSLPVRDARRQVHIDARAATGHVQQDRRQCGPENRADGLLSVELTGRPQPENATTPTTSRTATVAMAVANCVATTRGDGLGCSWPRTDRPRRSSRHRRLIQAQSAGLQAEGAEVLGLQLSRGDRQRAGYLSATGGWWRPLKRFG
jgi:hypothetical protein